MSPSYSQLYPKLKKLLIGGDERTARTKKNILAMFVIRGLSQATGLLLVPLSLNYLTPTSYGIWLTLSSVITWFNFFDIGLGNGLRNKLAEALAKENFKLAREYVSTSYVLMVLIVIALFIVFLIVSFLVDWNSILNAPSDLSDNLMLVALITFSFFCIRFVLSLINPILMAYQQPAVTGFLDLLGNILNVGGILFLFYFTTSSLVNMSIVTGLSGTLVLAGATVICFLVYFRHIQPGLKQVQFARSKELIGLGTKFFILQISSIIMFSSSNIIITQIFSPSDVVVYNIAYKYYNTVYIITYYILLPFWSAYTEAYNKGDTQWILNTFKALKKIWLLLVLCIVLMTVVSDYVYQLWVGTSVKVPIILSIVMGFYVVLVSWNTIFGNFLNGTSKVSLSLIYSVFTSIIVIPLSIVIAKYTSFGLAGVMLAVCLCLLPGAVLWPLQAKKIITGQARGIWNK